MSQEDRKSQNQITPVKITQIRAVGFHYYLLKPGTKAFVTTINEINRILKEQNPEKLCLSNINYSLSNNTDIDIKATIIKAQIPKAYHKYTDIFSTILSDWIPKYRDSIDYSINKGDKTFNLGYCPLYKLSFKELKVCKDYIIDKLKLRFIVPSLAPFVSLVLMAYILNRKLCFYIDFCKLNIITKKDRYLLSLIDKLLQRISKARFFTKLNIR